MKKSKSKFLDHGILWPSIAIFALFCLYVAKDGQVAGELLNKVANIVTGNFGWLYQVSIFAYFIVFLYLAFGKYSQKKLGEKTPSFSTATWLGLLFTSSSSASVLVWTSLESYYYVKFPPYEFAPFSLQAYEWAQAYSLFHWGPITFAMYSVMGIVFGYAIHVKKINVFRPSGIFALLHGKDFEKSWKGKAIDILALVSLVCGYGTSLGICTPLIAKILEHSFGLTASIKLDATIILIITGLITLCLYAGLYKGIAVLSNIRVYLGYTLLIVLFLIGPTAFIVNNFVSSVGIMLQNAVRMTFYTAPFGDNPFPQGWTVFYFAWFTALSTVCGIYLAMISGGRTVRQVLFGSLGAYVLGNWIYFFVLQNYAISLQKQDPLPFDKILETGGTAGVTMATWALFPHSTIFILAFLVLAYIATTTFVNSAVYTCAVFTTKELEADEEPTRFLRIFWALLIGCIALALLYIGGLNPVQKISIIGSLPMTIIIMAMIYTFFKVAKRDNW